LKLRFKGLLPLIFVLISACASYTDETRQIRSSYMGRDYKSALAKLEESSLKSSSNSKLLYLLEKAMILQRMGETQKSRALLIEADKLVDRLYTVSVSKTAASFVYNDSATDYAGEDFEKVAIHTMLALSFLGDKDLDSARVSARKINSKLSEIVGTYDGKKGRYTEDAFAVYLAGLIYEAKGEWDSAIIDYAKALELYESGYKIFIRGSIPDTLIQSLYRLLVKRNRKDRVAALEAKYPNELKGISGSKADDDFGDVVVIHEKGHIAIKVAEDTALPIGKQIVRISWPVIRKSSRTGFGDSGLTVENGPQVTAENLQDMDAVATVGLEDRKLRMVAKNAARLLAKGQITEQAYKNFGLAGGIAANVFSAVSETADTRSWTLLPESYNVSRVRLKPGSHTVRIKTNGRQTRIEKVEVKKGQIVIFTDFG
jgi:hypothetical protein